MDPKKLFPTSPVLPQQIAIHSVSVPALLCQLVEAASSAIEPRRGGVEPVLEYPGAGPVNPNYSDPLSVSLTTGPLPFLKRGSALLSIGNSNGF